MKQEQLKQRLIDKVEREYKKFVFNLKSCDKDTIIDKAYEKVCKEEILSLIQYKTFETDELKAMLNCKNVLNECYDEWMHNDGGFNILLEDSIDERIGTITENFIEKKLKMKQDRGR